MRKKPRQLLLKVGMFIVLLSLSLSAATVSQSASFDCNKAATKVEKMICADPELAKLDDELAGVYQKAMKAEGQAEVTKLAQKDWLKERNLCKDNGCLKEKYSQRLAVLIRDLPQYVAIYPPDLTEFQVDCKIAKSIAEKFICRQAGTLQEQGWIIEHHNKEMLPALQWALMRSEEEEKLLESQRKWQKEVRDACTDVRCCLIVYSDRIEDLRAMWERPGSCYTLKPLDDGNDSGRLETKINMLPIEPVCQAMEENLNQFCDQPPMACGLKVAPQFQGQITFPDWEPLKPVANLGLIEEFVRAPWEFDTNKGAAEPIWLAERLEIETALADNNLTFSKTQLDLYNLGKLQPAYRLAYGTCIAENQQLGSDHTQRGEPIIPARVEIQQSPEVVRQLFRQFEPIGHSGASEVFIYGGKFYSFWMIPVDDGKNSLYVNRHERWVIPGELNIKLHLKHICHFEYEY